jgi:hypothetical protein
MHLATTAGGNIVVLSGGGLYSPDGGSVGVTFDYYISTTGSDSNAGTLGSPWAITSFTRTNANNTLMAGKKTGLIAGTYAVNSMWVTKDATGTGYEDPALNVPAGTSGSPTYIASCDTSGNYLARAAMITASTNGVPGTPGVTTYFPTGANNSTAIMGQYYGATQGNFVIDGLQISDTTGYLIAVFVNTGTPTGGVVQNCELFNIGGSEGNNPAAVMWSGPVIGFICKNNKVHDGFITGAGNHNIAGFFTLGIGGSSCQYFNNTVYNMTSTVYHKNGQNGGHTHAYNYYENSGGTNPEGVFVDSGSNTVGKTFTAHHNIFITVPGQNIMFGHMESVTPADTPAQSMVFYSNTCFITGYGQPQTGFFWQTTGSGSSPAATVTHYNNIYAMTAGGSGGGGKTVMLGSAAGATILCDYNGFVGTSTPNFSVGSSTLFAPTTSYSTLAAWTSGQGWDSHSFAQASTSGVFTNVGVALTPTGYQLGISSPCKSVGSTNGTTGGSACDLGAYGYDPATNLPNPTVGCNF